MHEKDMDKGNAFTQRNHKEIAREKDCHTNIRNQQKVAFQELNHLNQDEDLFQRALRHWNAFILLEMYFRTIFIINLGRRYACSCVLWAIFLFF
jgi:hypothetical protein